MMDIVLIKDKVIQSLEASVQQAKDGLTGFLYGTRNSAITYVCGFHISKNADTADFEEEFDKSSSFLPAGIGLCGIFFKMNQADVIMIIKNLCKKILPPTSVLRDCFATDKILVMSLDEKTKRSNLYWFSFEQQNLWRAEVTTTDKDEIGSLGPVFRIMGTLSIGFEHDDVSNIRGRRIQAEVDYLKDTINSSLSVFHIEDSDLLLYNRPADDWPESSVVTTDSTVADLMDYLKSDKETRTKMKTKYLGQNVVCVQLMLHSTGNHASGKFISCTPVIHHDHKKFRYVDVRLPLDVLAVAQLDTSIGSLLTLFIDAIGRQLNAMSISLSSSCQGSVYYTPRPFHFHPDGMDSFVTVIYPEGIPDANLDAVRKHLHEEFLLPLTKPIFKRSNALTFSHISSSNGCLLDVHIGLNQSGVSKGKQCLVSGSYEYHHYMQDKVDDNGWGCAYRSLQTLASWLNLQSYTDKAIPTHTQIQQALVDVGDKPSTFAGSRQWIGSTEVGYVLDQLFGVSCKILHVSSGAEMTTKAREIAHHFQTQGSPIMIGGGVLAHTIIGIDWNEGTGDVKFLILDPHYTGADDLKVIQDKGWCGWKGPEFWNQQAYYNMCMPQKPILF